MTTSASLTREILQWAAAVAAAFCCAQAQAQADNEQLARGKYLLHAGGCISCHVGETRDDKSLAGGHAIESPFGVFYSPNITPDKETGIGNWSDDDFVTAFWEGESPEGDHYFPAFPYTAYTGMSRQDLLDLKAYLFTLEPVRRENKEHDLWPIMSSRFAAGIWKATNFAERRVESRRLPRSPPRPLRRVPHAARQPGRAQGRPGADRQSRAVGRRRGTEHYV